jgi:hypothetical protein
VDRDVAHRLEQRGRPRVDDANGDTEQRRGGTAGTLAMG